MVLAAQMNKNARARVRDVLPCVRRVEWHSKNRTSMTPQIWGYHIPQVFRTELSCDCSQQEAWNRGHPLDGHHTPSQTYRYVPRGWDSCVRTAMIHKINVKSSHGWYALPDHNCWTWDPNIVCKACKHWAHTATNCDMLAMALFLEKYVKVSMTPNTCNRIEVAGLQW